MFSIPSANDSKAETDPLPLLRHNAPHPVSNSISSHGQPFPHNSRVFFNGLKSAKFSGGSVISYQPSMVQSNPHPARVGLPVFHVPQDVQRHRGLVIPEKSAL
ncbi:unnamed protein product [Linum tenue]|uniref:Uncharacterized protein n=1 Tax=Linum tenue TaxID=586396 RepID=A0AAV0JG81_9ROSI|nr:unnamed protein product [Linum tenue]